MRTMALWATVVVVVLLTSACGGTGSAPTVEGPGEADSSLSEGVPLHLLITNQDFARPMANLTVAIDGGAVVSDDFAVQGQHNVQTYEVEVEEGRRQLTVASEHGEEYASDISIREETWVMIQYWGDADETFVVRVEDQPIGIE